MPEEINERVQARSTRNRGTRGRVEGYGLSLEAWSSSLPAGIRLQRPVRAEAVLYHRHGQPCRRGVFLRRNHARPLTGAAAPAAVTRRRGPLPAPQARRRVREPRKQRHANIRSRCERARSVSCGLRPAPARGKPRGAVSPSPSPFAPAALGNGPLPPEHGLAPMSVINGSGRSRQWWA